MIFHESKFDETAFNPESKSKCYRAAKTKEAKQRCASSGLMQIIQGLHGGADDTLEQHIERGVRILGRHFKKNGGSVFRAVAAYNGSGEKSRSYARAVLADARRFGYRG